MRRTGTIASKAPGSQQNNSKLINKVNPKDSKSRDNSQASGQTSSMLPGQMSDYPVSQS